MVSSQHEVMHQIFRNHPGAVGRAFQTLGFDFPDTVTTSVLGTDLTEYSPIERRADTVVRIDTKDGNSLLVVVEAQLKPDPGKLRSWPYYVATLHERHLLPVILIVLSQERRTSLWAQQPIHVGTAFWTCMTVRPLVLGPHNVPFPSGAIDEEDLPLAALAAVIHGREPGIDGILRVLADALEKTDEATRSDLSVLVELGLAGLPAVRIWRSLKMFTRERLSKSPVLREILDQTEEQGRAEGRAEGRAADILRILDKRKVALTDAERERISGCSDLVVLDRWFDAALDAETAGQLFAV
jgi:hypothetical protein